MLAYFPCTADVGFIPALERGLCRPACLLTFVAQPMWDSDVLSYNVCAASLQAVPVSHVTNLQGLAVIAMELALHNATNTLSTIKELSNNKSLDPFALVCLKDCLQLYSDAITTLVDAVGAFLSEDYGTANTWVSTIMEATTTCEGGLWHGEDWILSRILKFATDQEPQGISKFLRGMVCPGSEIPEWFSNQSVGHSIDVELPPPSCTNWLGIAFCVVFQDLKRHYDYFEIRCLADVSPKILTKAIRSLESEHLWVFYLLRRDCRGEKFLFSTCLNGCIVEEAYFNVKKCGARLLYKQDLEELNQPQNPETNT